MLLSDILTRDRVLLDADGSRAPDKRAALARLAELFAGEEVTEVEALTAQLLEREQLQSTGIGDGVAIPHAAVDSARHQSAAVLLCPQGLAFDAIDGAPVTLIVGLVGPRRATGEHLRALARISRLLRSADMRRALLEAPSSDAAYDAIVAADAALG